MHDDVHWLQDKLDDFLNSKPALPPNVIQEATQSFHDKLQRFNELPRERSTLPSLSQVGKPFCILHAEKLNWKPLPKTPSFKLKMTYGDMTEVLAVAILKAAGVNIFAINQRTVLHTEEGELNGEFDIIIQDEAGQLTLWDIKSASRYAFDSKFKSYEALKETDSFGYVSQLFGYTRAERAKYHDLEAGGWIVINKETGDIKICPANPADENLYYDKIVDTIKRYKTADKDNFKRDFSDVEETFYKKLTGNRKLAITCSYCDYKYTCWPDLQYRKRARSKSANAFEYYTFFQEEPKDISSVSEG